MNSSVNKPDQKAQDDEISLKELILKLREWNRYLLSKWKVIVLAGIIGGLLGFLYTYLKKPTYTAECTFVLEEQGSVGGLGQYAGIASMVGLDLGSTGSNGIFQGDNIMELYRSRSMITQTLLSPANFNGKKELLINRFIEFNKLRQKWAEKPDLANLSFDIPLDRYTLRHDSIIGEIVKDIKNKYLTVSKPDKKLSIIRVQVRSKDELFASQYTNQTVQNVNNFYVQTKTKKAFDNLRILQKQADSVKRVLNYSIGDAAAAGDANPNANPALQILRVPSQRRQMDVQASSAIYAEIVKNLEIAKISLRKDTPLIQIIDKPVLPLETDRIKAFIGLLSGLIIGGSLCALFLLTKRLFMVLMN